MLLSAMLLAASDPACVRDGNQMQLNACAAQDLARADAALNGQWRRSLAVARRDGVALRAAQRAWLAFRDAECEAEEAPSIGGSMHGMAIALCKTTLTQARTRQLADLAHRK